MVEEFTGLLNSKAHYLPTVFVYTAMSFIKLLPLKMMGLTRRCLSRTSEKPANRAIQSEPLKFAQPLNTF